MAVQSGNVEQLMGWLADGSDARSAQAAAEPLVQKLADLVFQGDSGWPNHADRVDSYRDALAAWFVGDDARASQFAYLTAADSDPGACIDWFLSVVGEWEQRARGEYPYAASADGADWATDEQHRYSEPARDENYGLDYRLDHTHQVYEWYDEASGTWRDQTWADLYAAQRHDPAAAVQSSGAGGDAQPEWDENWAKFYRVGPGGVYEFADARTPGDKSSGCTDQWLSHEQVLQRQATAAPETPRETILKHIPDIAQIIPDFDQYTDDEVAEAVEVLLSTIEKG